MFLQEVTEADNHLKTYFTTCPTDHVKQHLPFDFNDRNAVTDIKNLKTLCQDGYIIRYSTERRTPLFTAERLFLSTTVRKFHYTYMYMYLQTHNTDSS